jgi:hypothetical protein
MMEKPALAGARPPPVTPVTITYNVAVYALAERADTLLLFHLYHLSALLPLSAINKEFVELSPFYYTIMMTFIS